jgi:hypothetical protein
MQLIFERVTGSKPKEGVINDSYLSGLFVFLCFFDI